MNRTFEEELEMHGSFLFKNVGTSMMPLLRQNKDLFFIESKKGRSIKKYDVVLFKRANGRYVLHRIVKVRKNDYVLCGDHLYRREYGIMNNQILGVMTKVIRDGKAIHVNDWKYKLYVHIWCDFFYIRVIILWTKAFFAKKIVGKINEKN